MSLIRGTLDLLLLRTLEGGASHGYTLVEAIRRRSGGHLEIEEGALYPALKRMRDRGWITAEWGRSEQGRRARFHRLTEAGQQALEQEWEQWTAYVVAVEGVLEAPEGA